MLAIVIVGLVRSPQNKNVHYRHPQRHDCQSVHLYKYQTQLKSVFKMFSMCSNASFDCLIISSSNTWWKKSHSSIRSNFSWSTSWFRLRYTRSCSFPQIWESTGFRSGLFAPYHFSCLSTLIKTRSSAENTMCSNYAVGWWKKMKVQRW